MDIYDFMIVKDEVDILAQTLRSLEQFGGFRKIFIFDNGSADGTFELLQTLVNDRIALHALSDLFSDKLKFENVYRHGNILKEGDWFAILDADEIYQESLYPIVQTAESENANYIESQSAQFYFTEFESNYDFDPSIPATRQRQYYLLNYGEPRVFRFSEKIYLTSDRVKARDPVLTPCSRKLLMHHFQFRSTDQTQRRLNVRMANHSHSNNWGHINSANWKDYIVPAKHLHKFDGSIISGLPADANLYKIRDNAAYTMANLNWLKKNNYLTAAQLGFFNATHWQRLIRKLL